MVNSIQISLFIVIANLVFPINLGLDIKQTTEWELEKHGNGIFVYTRAVKGSDIKEFKAITFTTQPMAVLEKAIEEVSKYPSWQENVTTASMLKQVDSTEMYMYYTTDIPWPLSDRDIVIHSKKTIAGNGTVTYAMKGVPDYIEKLDDFIRIPIANGVWEFTPVKESRIRIVFQFYGAPGGSIPDWLVNLFIVAGPYGTLKNLKTLK